MEGSERSSKSLQATQRILQVFLSWFCFKELSLESSDRDSFQGQRFPPCSVSGDISPAPHPSHLSFPIHGSYFVKL